MVFKLDREFNISKIVNNVLGRLMKENMESFSLDLKRLQFLNHLINSTQSGPIRPALNRDFLSNNKTFLLLTYNIFVAHIYKCSK